MNQGLLKFIWVVVLLSLFVGASADPIDQWTWRFPMATGQNMYAVTYGNGQFVAVGDNGLIVTSTDGYNWTIQNPGNASALVGVAYADGEYAAVGGNTILISSNAVTWTQMPSM